MPPTAGDVGATSSSASPATAPSEGTTRERAWQGLTKK